VRGVGVRTARNLFVAIAIAACAGGCGPPEKFGWPALFAPGPAPLQQQRFARFDPYAEYGPALGESRPPRGAGDLPLPEATRDRWKEWGQLRYGYP